MTGEQVTGKQVIGKQVIGKQVIGKQVTGETYELQQANPLANTLAALMVGSQWT